MSNSPEPVFNRLGLRASGFLAKTGHSETCLNRISIGPIWLFGKDRLILHRYQTYGLYLMSGLPRIPFFKGLD